MDVTHLQVHNNSKFSNRPARRRGGPIASQLGSWFFLALQLHCVRLRPCLVLCQRRVSAKNVKKSRRTVRVRRVLDSHALCEKQDDERGAAKTQIADGELRSAYTQYAPRAQTGP
jgi:hypothetical protein